MASRSKWSGFRKSGKTLNKASSDDTNSFDSTGSGRESSVGELRFEAQVRLEPLQACNLATRGRKGTVFNNEHATTSWDIRWPPRSPPLSLDRS